MPLFGILKFVEHFFFVFLPPKNMIWMCRPGTLKTTLKHQKSRSGRKLTDIY